MTTSPVSCDPVLMTPAGSTGPTLADVLSRVPELNSASQRARQNMASSIRTLCRVLDRSPEFVQVSAPAIRNAVQSAQPAAVGVTPSRWRNVVSDVRRAIRLTGLGGRAEFSDARSHVLTRRWIESGELPSHRLGRQIRISEAVSWALVRPLRKPSLRACVRPK